MALRIVKKHEAIEVKQLVAAIYGPPGLGKSTLGFTADAPILLDFDGGAYRAGNRGDVVSVEQWKDVTAIAQKDLADYRTVIIDTAGRALDMLTADIIKRNPKQGRGGALTLQGYGALKAEFAAWIKNLRTFGLDIVLLAHSSEDKSGDDIIERIDVQGGSKGEIYKMADLMGRLSIRDGQRTLNFSPTETAFGKNPANLEVVMVPDYNAEPNHFGGIMRTVKGYLNSMSAEQQELSSSIDDWRSQFEQADAAELNNLIAQVAEADVRVRDNLKRLMVQIAKGRGITFDLKRKEFIGPEPETVKQPKEAASADF